MATYEVLSEIDTGIEARDLVVQVINVLTDAEDQDSAATVLRTAARQLMGLNGDALTIYAYIEREAVKWQGWIARVEYRRGGVPLVFFDNDPVLREAVYRDLSEQG